VTDVGVALKTILRADVDVAALVGTRVYAFPLRQTPVLPDLTYQRVSGPRDALLGIAKPRYQFTAWSESYGEARDVAQAVDDCLQRYKGTSEGVLIIQATVVNDTDLYDPETGRHTCTVDVMLKYWED
jgi:hypothetical protein